MPSIHRRAGRPRQSGVVSGDPKHDVVRAAAKLFAKQGFADTTMSGIAAAAGLHQSSLYYWYSSKEDILRAVMDQNRESLAAARVLVGDPAPAGARLYLVLYLDVMQMCRAPLDFFELESAARNQRATFGEFFRDYAELAGLLRTIATQGMANGDLQVVDPEILVRTALSLNEGSQFRYHSGIPGTEDPHGFARAAAHTLLCAILRDRADIDVIETLAKAGIAGFRAGEEQSRH